MLNSKAIFPGAVATGPSRHSLLTRVKGWLQRYWQSECRRADRPDRVVPYY